ncbi:MAG: peptidylprolyl isomerase [[Clostridium] fimetarium]|nr:peptidylprolyl isomerase [Alistipes timonensis]MCM1405627.1 peptidylprolyl isomerase [[Clostridium] fimetarium]
MKKSIIWAIVAVCALAAGAAALTTAKKKTTRMTDKTTAAATTAAGDALVDIKTTAGDLTVRLFGDTPKHRDNFLKLVKEGYYDGVLFHRVINEFMIQTGDPESKNAPAGKMLGAGGPGYNIDAEIVYPKHFHKYGALAAARQGDQVNPERRSSGSQFYIVTGKTYNDSTLAQMEQRAQQMQIKEIFDRLASERRDSIMNMRRNRDMMGLQALQDELVKMAQAEAQAHPALLTAEQREAYKTVGGAPHLDGQYTVFGEVVKGLDVVKKIETAETDGRDRPKEDIRVISMKVVKE